MPLNSEAILQLASFIASRPDLPFDMAEANWPSCNTAGCIGGFAAALWPEFQSGQSFDDWELEAHLGLSAQQRYELFYPRFNIQFTDVAMPASYGLITRAGACATLTRLAASGKVQWLLVEQSPDSAPVQQPETTPEEPLL